MKVNNIMIHKNSANCVSRIFKQIVKLSLPYGVVNYVQTRHNKKRKQKYYKHNLIFCKKLKETLPNIPIILEIFDRSGEHSITPEHMQFWFVSNCLNKLKPTEVYDIGSHRSWLLGVGAAYKLHTLDVRGSELALDNEIAHIGRAEELPFESNSIECITSICSLEHFGLGSYGDPFDPFGDRKAISEVKRVLRPGGHYIFTTCITGGDSFIVFNTRRVYSLDTIYDMLNGDMKCIDQRLFSMKKRKLIDKSELVQGMKPYSWDIYLGNWKKVR